MVRPTAERLLSRLWRCCSIALIATAALAQLVLLDPGEPATAALLPAEAMEEVELCISSFDYCKVGDVRIVMMNFQ